MSRGPYRTWDCDVSSPRKLRRVQAGLSQAELAELARVSERTVRNWEQAATDLTWRARSNIDNVLWSIENGHLRRPGQVAGLTRPETGKAGAST